LTNRKPTREILQSEDFKIKGWLKHPLLKTHSPNQVLDSWKNDFQFKEEDAASHVNGLRTPQIGALYNIMGHLKMPLESGIVVLPTGTGKTETMLSALVANRCMKLLVAVPSDALRNQISNKFLELGLLKDFGIVGETSLHPIVGIVKQRFMTLKEATDFFQECNVVVTTMNILTSLPGDQQNAISNICSHFFIDEAHHVKAGTWDAFTKCFDAKKIIQYTATPFRNDGKRIEGKMIFNFPLKEAQNQGYFQKIDFLPIREYNPKKSDITIAETAINKLREDLSNGLNHILMARCANKERARTVYQLYEKEQDLNPILLYSGVKNFKDNYAQIIEKKARIIVCVDMLGEGFDLPELKIAAFHDIRKSLPITLQFAGRFTRTKFDEELGNACFIANIANVDVKDELEELYARDADWNRLLSDISHAKIEEEGDYKNLLQGFTKLADSNIPFQNIKPKLSTVVYKNKTDTWHPRNYEKGVSGLKDCEYKFFDINNDEKMFVLITAKRQELDWVKHKDIYALDWKLILVYWETKNNLLFINSSDNSSLYKELAQAVIGENAEMIDKINVFKAFHNIQRTKLHNVGLRLFLGKDIRFRMSVGSDVGEALGIAERQKGEKAFVVGVGYENGEPVNIGCSYKGRIWTKLVGDIGHFKNWCTNLGTKLANDNLDPNQILRETLIPQLVIDRPEIFPVWIDWDVEMYMSHERRFRFLVNGSLYDMANCELVLTNPSDGGNITFALVTEHVSVEFELQLFENTDTDTVYPDFKIVQKTRANVEVEYGSNRVVANKFFEEFVPTIWFADGSSLTGNVFYSLKQIIAPYPKENIIAWDWAGVDLGKEAQKVEPKVAESIQYKVIQELKRKDFDIIYDDDYSGEIADVLALKLYDDRLEVKMYHLKYAVEGKVSNSIKNLYEVCGQAQKSVHWKHKDGREFISHLLRREPKTRKGASCSRLEKGTMDDLENLFSIVKQQIPVKYEIFIVQPGISKANATDDILTLLGVTENYIKEIAGIETRVITSK
jgi:superfamily II DNA or RNA helicase